MIAYVLLLLLTLAVAFTVVRLLRSFKSWGDSGAKFVTLPTQSMVSLSSGSGKLKAGRQQGLVKTGRPAKAKTTRLPMKVSKGPVRKPWGW